MPGVVAMDAERALREARATLVQASDLFEQAGFGALAMGLLEDALVALDTALDCALDVGGRDQAPRSDLTI